MICNVYVQGKTKDGIPAAQAFQVTGEDTDSIRQDLINQLDSIPQRVLMEVPKQKVTDEQPAK